MKLEGCVDVTYVNMITKFCYDQINISFRNALLKNMSNFSKFGSHEKPSKIKLSHFHSK